MQPSSITKTETPTHHHTQKVSTTPIHNVNNIQVENKPSEAVLARDKATQKSLEASSGQKTLTQKKNADHRVDLSLNEGKTEKKIEKRQENTIADSKIAEQKLHQQSNQLNNDHAVAKLEAHKTYSQNESKKQTALQVATEKADLLESVKSVGADGTETYYFPVPVQVLAQLPPPGNIGISAKKMEELLSNKTQLKQDSDNQRIELSSEKASKSYLSAQNKQDNNTEQGNYSASTNNKYMKNTLDYGFG